MECFSFVCVSFVCVHGDGHSRGRFFVVPQVHCRPEVDQGDLLHRHPCQLPHPRTCWLLTSGVRTGLFPSVCQDLLMYSRESASSVSSCLHREARWPCLVRKRCLSSSWMEICPQSGGEASPLPLSPAEDKPSSSKSLLWLPKDFKLHRKE